MRAGGIAVHYVEHGAGRPVLVLHGAGVDHREAEACFEPVFDGVAGFRRIYPDLPGMGRTAAPDGLRSAEDVLDTLLDFAGEVTDGAAYLLIGHSAGAYYAQAMAARAPGQVAGLALVCPLLPGLRDVPEHRVVVGSGEIGDDEFRSYFVVQTPEMLERYERYVRPGGRARRPGGARADRRAVGARPRSRAGVRGSDAGRGGAAGLDGRVRGRRGPRGPLPARLARGGR